jgi:hypothetical protein
MLLAIPAASFAEDWQRAEVRFGVNAAEIIWPVFGEQGKVQPRFRLIAGVSWRPVDVDPLDDDGVKPVGVWLGGSIDVDNDPFNYVEFGAGASYEEAVHAGLLLWVGNSTEDDGETVQAVPGLDIKLKTVIGLGLDAEP